MSLEDLMDRGMEIADFRSTGKTEEFYAILDELEMPDSLDTGMLSFRVTLKTW